MTIITAHKSKGKFVLMKKYITKTTKTPLNQKLINESLDILESVGIPFEKKTEKGLQSMAM